MGLWVTVFANFDSRRRLNCLQSYFRIWYACCETGSNWKRWVFELLNAHDNTTVIGLSGVNGRPKSFNSDVNPGVVKIIDAGDIKHDVTYE